MLKREIGRWDLILLMTNGIIGAGIFGLPSILYGALGVYSVPFILLGALIIFIISLSFAYVSKRFKESGGPYFYTLKAFGKKPAFFIGWILLFSGATSYAALINLLMAYTLSFLPDVKSYANTIVIFVTLGLGLINLLGIKESTILNNVLSILKITSLVGFAILGLYNIDLDFFELPPTAPKIEDLSVSALILVFSFTGFEAVLVASGEIKKPKGNIPFALFISLGLVALIYSVIQVVCIGTLSTLPTSTTPLADSSEIIVGQKGRAWITLTAIVSILGTLNASMLIGSRILFSMGLQDQLPIALSHTSQRFATPHYSILLFAALAAIFSICGSFLYSASMSAISKVMVFLMISLALLKFKIEDQVILKKKTLKHQTIAVLGIAGSACLLSFSRFPSVRDILVVCLAGFIVHFITVAIRKRPINK